MVEIAFCRGLSLRPSVSANHRPAGWGPRHCGWSDYVCATVECSCDHLMRWRGFALFSWASSCRAEVAESRLACGNQNPARCLHKTQDSLQLFPWPLECSCCTVAQVRMRGCICSCLWWVRRGLHRCPGHQCMYRTGFFWHQRTHLRIHSSGCMVCTCARVCAVCSLALGDEGGKV